MRRKCHLSSWRNGQKETISQERGPCGYFLRAHIAYTDVYICTHHVICKVCTAVHCNDAVFHGNERQKEKVCVPIRSKSHTDSGTPSRCLLPVHRLPCKAFPRSRATSFPPLPEPHLLAFSGTKLTFPLQVPPLAPDVGMTGQSKAASRNRFPPNSSQGFFWGLGTCSNLSNLK